MNKKILFVDDQEDIQEIVSDFLRNCGYEVYCASNGKEAQAKLEKRDFDLVITDLMMPDMNGFEFIKIFRQKSSVPVIVVSGSGAEENHAKELQTLIDSNYPILEKPFSKDRLISHVEKHIGKGF